MIGCRSQFIINEKLWEFTGNTEPYAGKNIIQVGDFNQVGPVFDKSTAEDYMTSKKKFSLKMQKGHFLFNNSIKDCFIQSFNFRSTPEYASALKQMSVVKPDQKTIESFNKRVIQPYTILPSGTKVLTATNNVRLIFNELGFKEYLLKNGIKHRDDFENNFENNLQYLKIVADVKFKNIDKRDHMFLNSVYNHVRNLDQKNLKGIQGNISVFVGGPFMITKNVNVNQGIANGIEYHLGWVY